MMKDLKGVVVPLVTPFNEDESLNEVVLRKIVDYVLDHSVHGLFPCGGQGEFWALTTDERKRILDIVVDQSGGRALVLAGTGAVTTAESIELSRYAEAAGADGVAVITPYYIKPSEEELREHYLRIAESIGIPVLAYNNPGRTDVPLSPALVAGLAQEADNFVGVKDSSGDLTNTISYIQQCPPSFSAFMGRDTLIYAGLCCGCAGVVASTANVVPELVVGIYDAFVAGDHDLALERQRELDPLRQAFSLGSFPVTVKDAMTLVGLPAGPCRAPIRSLSSGPRDRLVAILRDLGKLD
jgi:4-hydroxy-tetrahydrodipicolinate synthase